MVKIGAIFKCHTKTLKNLHLSFSGGIFFGPVVRAALLAQTLK